MMNVVKDAPQRLKGKSVFQPRSISHDVAAACYVHISTHRYIYIYIVYISFVCYTPSDMNKKKCKRNLNHKNPQREDEKREDDKKDRNDLCSEF